MTSVQVEKVIARPPRDVFDFVATHHLENHSKWDPEVVEMTQTSPGPVGAGTTGRVVRRQGRRTVDGTVTVIEYQPDETASWDVQFGSFRLRQTVRLVPDQRGTATRLRLSIDTVAHGPLRVLVPLLRSRFRRTMARSLATIADCLEQC